MCMETLRSRYREKLYLTRKCFYSYIAIIGDVGVNYSLPRLVLRLLSPNDNVLLHLTPVLVSLYYRVTYIKGSITQSEM